MKVVSCLQKWRAAIVLCVGLCGAQEIRYAAEFNQVPVECRSAAMGNTGVVLMRNGASSFWNPARPALVPTTEIAVEGAKLYGNLSNLGVASLSVPVQNDLAASGLYTGFFSGEILEQDSLSGTPLERLYNPELRANGNDSRGVFHNNQHRLQLGLARTFSIPVIRPVGLGMPLPIDLAAGVNFKYFWQTMTPGDDIRMGFNVNMDFGAAVSIGADFDFQKQEITRRILVGFAFRDFLPTQVMWVNSPSDYREPVHYSQFYGISYTDNTKFLHGNWAVSLALHKLYETSVHAGLEGEFWDMVSFRVGISDRTPTVGAGIRTDIFRLDYAFSFDELAFSPVRLSIGFSF